MKSFPLYIYLIHPCGFRDDNARYEVLFSFGYTLKYTEYIQCLLRKACNPSLPLPFDLFGPFGPVPLSHLFAWLANETWAAGYSSFPLYIPSSKL